MKLVNVKKYAKRNKRTICGATQSQRLASFFFSLRERTVASYFQISFVRIYCIHRRSSSGSMLIVRVYIGRIFRLEIFKLVIYDYFFLKEQL